MNTETAVVTATETTTANVAEVTPVESVTKVSKKNRIKYGTGLLVKRVVLSNGQPVGRGRPVNGNKSKRTVVYIPLDAVYDVDIYGTGSRFRKDISAAPIKTVVKEQFFAKYPKAIATPVSS
jgi:hypothetical protein